MVTQQGPSQGRFAPVPLARTQRLLAFGRLVRQRCLSHRLPSPLPRVHACVLNVHGCASPVSPRPLLDHFAPFRSLWPKGASPQVEQQLTPACHSGSTRSPQTSNHRLESAVPVFRVQTHADYRLVKPAAVAAVAAVVLANPLASLRSDCRLHLPEACRPIRPLGHRGNRPCRCRPRQYPPNRQLLRRPRRSSMTPLAADLGQMRTTMLVRNIRMGLIQGLRGPRGILWST